MATTTTKKIHCMIDEDDILYTIKESLFKEVVGNMILEAKNKQLRKYAQHLPDCNTQSLIPQVKNGKKICTCGFEQAMKKENRNNK